MTSDELEVTVYIERDDSEVEVSVLVHRYGHHDPDYEFEYNEDVFSASECEEIEVLALNAYIDHYDKLNGDLV